jgi:hypothetical protein
MALAKKTMIIGARKIKKTYGFGFDNFLVITVLPPARDPEEKSRAPDVYRFGVNG